jgi:GDPmannose 4,6-dehydratase
VANVTRRMLMIVIGETHTIKEFINLALAECGIEFEWIGEGIDESSY